MRFSDGSDTKVNYAKRPRTDDEEMSKVMVIISPKKAELELARNQERCFLLSSSSDDSHKPVLMDLEWDTDVPESGAQATSYDYRLSTALPVMVKGELSFVNEEEAYAQFIKEVDAFFPGAETKYADPKSKVRKQIKIIFV